MMGPMPPQLPTRPLASRTRIMLAVLFGLLTVGVVGMHLLSADHQLATPEPVQHHDASGADTHHHAAAQPVTDPGGAGAAVAFLVPAGIDHGCADCDHHTMMLGSCLLALIFGLLWQLRAPTRGRSWPTPLRTESGTPANPPPAARTHRAALTHLELSINRTISIPRCHSRRATRPHAA